MSDHPAKTDDHHDHGHASDHGHPVATDIIAEKSWQDALLQLLCVGTVVGLIYLMGVWSQWTPPAAPEHAEGAGHGAEH